MHYASYQKDLRKLSLQCVNVKGNHIVEKWGSKIEIKNANPNDVMEFHWETNEALAHTKDDQEGENPRLKQRIVELEAALIPRPLFVEPLAIVQLVEESPGQFRKIDKVTHFFV